MVGAALSFSARTVTRICPRYSVRPYASNTDPFAVKETPDNEWGMDPPHIMVVVPDPKVLQGMPTKRSTTQPWVMYAGTPYAHIMIPVESRK